MAGMEPRRRRRWSWKRIALVTAAGCTVCGGLTLWGLLRTPGWYRPEASPDDRAARQEIRNNLVRAEQAFTSSLLDGRPFRYRIYQRHVNEWLAMRHDFYPRIDAVVPPIVSDPYVTIGDGRVRIAGRYAVADRHPVVSVEFEPAFEDNGIVLRIADIRCGSVVIPNLLDELALDHPVALAANDAWPGSPPIRGSLTDGLHIGARGWWQNGGVSYEVTGVEVGEGVLTLSITPLERQARRSRH